MSVEILLSESSATGRQTDWVKCYLYQEDKNENLIPSYKREEAGYNNIATNCFTSLMLYQYQWT